MKIYTGEELVKLVAPLDHYLIEPGVLPRGGKLILGGGPKIGKTFLVLEIIASMLEGAPLFGHDNWFVRKGRTLLLEREIGEYSLATRVRDRFVGALDGTGDNFQIISKPRGFSLSNPGCVTWLAKFCKDQAIDLLLFDPINKLFHGDENNNSEMLRLVESLEALQDGKIGLVASHHFGKPIRGQGVDKWDSLDSANFRGASRLVDDADSLLMLQRVKGRLAPAWESWKLRCRLMVRHAPAPEDFLLHFNEVNDRRMVFYPLSSERAPTPEPKKVLEFPSLNPTPRTSV